MFLIIFELTQNFFSFFKKEILLIKDDKIDQSRINQKMKILGDSHYHNKPATYWRKEIEKYILWERELFKSCSKENMYFLEEYIQKNQIPPIPKDNMKIVESSAGGELLFDFFTDIYVLIPESNKDIDQVTEYSVKLSTLLVLKDLKTIKVEIVPILEVKNYKLNLGFAYYKVYRALD
jgi:hypothetical protein